MGNPSGDLHSPLPPGEIVKRLLAAMDEADQAGLPARRVYAGVGLSGSVSRDQFELGLPFHLLRHPSAQRVTGALTPDGSGTRVRIGWRSTPTRTYFPLAAIALILFILLVDRNPRILGVFCCLPLPAGFWWWEGRKSERILLGRLLELLEIKPG